MKELALIGFGDHTPKHEHDCDRCNFVGNYTHNGEELDLYHCVGGFDGETVIARYGEMGDYMSGLYFVDRNPALAEALARAEALGLRQPNPDNSTVEEIDELSEEWKHLYEKGQLIGD